MSRSYRRLYATSRTLAWSVVLLLSVSGCSSGSLRSFFGPPDDEMVSEVDVARTPPAAAMPERAARSVAKPAAPPMRPVVPTPMASIAGLGEDEVQRVMGEPQERSERDGRKTWIYRGAGCRVEVTFFRDVTRGTYSALAHKVVRTDGADTGRACVRGVRSAARR